MNIKRGMCPLCLKEDLEIIKRDENFKVRGEDIKVEVQIFKCRVCGEEFDKPRFKNDPYALAYQEYRRRHGLFQPEEIKAFRERYNLSQKEFSEVLGIGIASLNRYENGSLQSESHERIMRLIIDSPSNFLKRIQENLKIISEEKREKIISELKPVACKGLEPCYTAFVQYVADELSGNKELDRLKLTNAILLFCSGEGILKTALNKNLFYADFKHFKDYGSSITGLRYKRMPFGPVPDYYNQIYSQLEEEGFIEISEVEVFSYIGERFISLKQPDSNIFSHSELEVLFEIKKRLKDKNSTELSNMSHEEEAFKQAQMKDFISYKYAKTLTI